MSVFTLHHCHGFSTLKFSSKVAIIKRPGHLVWVDVENHTGYRASVWWPSFFEALQACKEKPTYHWYTLQQALPGKVDHKEFHESLNLLINRGLLAHGQVGVNH